MGDIEPSVGMQFDANSFVTLEGLTEFSSAVVPVVVVDGDEIQCAGTAFNIATDGVWVTARHVIRFALELAADRPGAAIGLLFVASGVGAEVPDLLGGFVPVAQGTQDDANGSDLGLMRAGMMKGDEPYAFPIARLSARVPKQGTHVLAMGYSRFTIQSDVTTQELREVVMKPNFSVSTGAVLQVFPEGRDTFRDLDGRPTGRLPTACFETSARFNPGMSGGPVFDESFAVCGVVSTGLNSDDEASDRSFASATPFLFTLGVTDGQQSQSVYQMVEQNIVATDEYFAQLTITEDGQLIYPCEN
ncbi:S1 family peptidase [Mycobacteroides salmoniphilum]|uniref:S1 family peptidase n=1 Tax=Mycobacteroides salmoniphilum TaxID=404941 RepID=UPI001066211A|nr:serine protease [Mycobacteroides salmoniphilum]TDZ93883.1 hypothetical protein CCUG62472_02067 [Mycobacteroides salmoniphilum]